MPHNKLSSLSNSNKPSFLRWILGRRDTSDIIREKARLEAFLGAFPGEYCGWADGHEFAPVYSAGFCDIFGLKQLNSLSDIQNALAPGDSAALESLFSRLRKKGQKFSITAESYDHKRSFKITGVRGTDLNSVEQYFVLWAEDVSEEIRARNLFAEESHDKDESLARFKMAMDAVPRPLWIRDGQQKIVWVNATYADFLGVKKDHIIRDQKEIFGQLRSRKKEAQSGHKDSPPGPILAKKCIENQRSMQTRVHNTIKGKRMLLNITETPLHGYEMTMGIAYNVTREEELENTLTRYTSANRELLEKLRSAIAIYNAEQRLEFYNAAFSQLWGLEDTWLNQEPKLGDIMEKLRETRRLPEQADFRKFKKTWVDMFTGLINPHEDMLYLPDGTALRMLVVPNSTGGLMMTFEDVTDRLALESSYNTLIAVQKETLDNLAEAVAVYGGDGRLKLSNPAFAKLWHLNPEDLDGEPHISKIVDRKRSFFEQDVWNKTQDIMRAKALDRSMREGRFVLKDGAFIDYTTVPLPDGGVLITYEDVTDKARVETALREKNTALETAERLKLDFLANVSYQLRTPLSAIMGFNEILENEYFGPLNDRQKSYTHDINVASHHLLDLINDILDLSTLEAGYMELDYEEISAYKMLHAVHDLMAEWARKEKIDLRLKCAKNIGRICVDQRRVQQAIINLIRNAINFTPGGGIVTLSGKRKQDGILITVEDTGQGISEEDLARIFEPFERAQGQKNNMRNGKGVGLGLSLVQNIIKLHGGDVDVRSEKGQGTAVEMFLPFKSISSRDEA